MLQIYMCILNFQTFFLQQKLKQASKNTTQNTTIILQ
jgi:hypothetical protein